MWEYAVYHPQSENEILDILQGAGQDGWELVQIWRGEGDPALDDLQAAETKLTHYPVAVCPCVLTGRGVP